MSSSRPDNLEALLSAYLDGELSDRERTDVERTLANDPQARATLESLRRTVELVSRLPRRAAPTALIDDLTARIEREHLLGNLSARPQPLSRRRSFRPMLASAAVLLFAVGGGYWAIRELSPAKPGAVTAVARKNDQRADRTTESPRSAANAPTGPSASPPAGEPMGKTSMSSVDRPPQPSAPPNDLMKQEVEKRREQPSAPPEFNRDIAKLGAEETKGKTTVASADPSLRDRAAGKELEAKDEDRQTQTEPDATAPWLNVSFENEADRTRCREETLAYLASNQVSIRAVDAKDDEFIVEVPPTQLGVLVDNLAAPAPSRRGLELQIDQYVVATGPEQVQDVLRSRRAEQASVRDDSMPAPMESAGSAKGNLFAAGLPARQGEPSERLVPDRAKSAATGPANDPEAILAEGMVPASAPSSAEQAPAATEMETDGPQLAAREIVIAQSERDLAASDFKLGRQPAQAASHPASGSVSGDANGADKLQPSASAGGNTEKILLRIRFLAAPPPVTTEPASRPATTAPSQTQPATDATLSAP